MGSGLPGGQELLNGKDNDGAENGANEAARTDLETVASPKAQKHPAHEGPEQSSDKEWSPIFGAGSATEDRLIPFLRPLTSRLDAKNILITTTLGGFGLGLIFVVGGDEARFSGVPELLQVTGGNLAMGAVLLAVVAKVAATAWCVSVGFRGGKIFPVAFIGGATGSALHLVIHGIPVGVAVGGGIAAALATGLRAPVTAVLIAASLVGPELLPLAVICVVVSHATHLLADQLAAVANPPDQSQGSHA